MGNENTATTDLSVSVVTYNSAHCLEGLFDSLSKQHGISWELFVVDNASADGTASRLAERMVTNVTGNPCNVGYGKAHNQNLSHFRGRYVLFLNPDLTFPAGLFAALVSFLDANPDVGIVGPTVLEGKDRAPFPPRRFYPGERMVALEPGLRRNYYAWLSGCCLAIRREVLNEMNGFDPDFFLYQEETDLCLRVRRAGYEIGWCPDWHVFHARLQSQTGLAEYDQERLLLEGTILFWRKHFAAADLPNLVRFQYFRASILLILYRSVSWFKKNRMFMDDKYRARRDICREWLIQGGYRIFALNVSVARIAFRQLRLAIEGVRSGRFPVDDY